MLHTYRFYSSYFVSQTFSKALIFFFTGTIYAISVVTVPTVARRFSFSQACTSHPSRGGRTQVEE